MPQIGQKCVGFRVDAEMAVFLASLPNASAFIRQAVIGALRMRCPLCRGSGQVLVGVGEHYIGVLRSHPSPTEGTPLEYVR